MPSILSTKKLKLNQHELLLNAGLSFVEYDAITIKPIAFDIPYNIKNVIITSQNGAKAIQNSELYKENYFVVGKKTAALLSKNGQKVAKIASNGEELAHFIAKNHKNEHFFYFCSKQRRAELPNILNQNNVSYTEVITYETRGNRQSFMQEFDGILFFSPSGVDAFAKANPSSLLLKGEKEGCVAFCIGETTANEARKHTDKVMVANDTAIESVIAKAVKYLKKNIN